MGKIYDEAFIDDELVDAVDWVVDDTLLHDETFKTWEHDLTKERRRDLSELGRILGNFTKSDFACAVIVAFRNHPYMVLQVIAEEITNKEGKSNE